MKNTGLLHSIINHLLPSAIEQTLPIIQNPIPPVATTALQRCTQPRLEGTLSFHFKSIPPTNIY